MAETLTIRTASSTEVVKIAVPGPQGPKGDKGDPGDVAGLPLTTQGDTLYRGASENQRLPIGTSGQVLKVSAGGIPEWANESGAVSSVAGKTGVVTLDKNDVGLGNVANTAQVTSVTGTAPIVSSGGTTPAISISAATTSAAGSMSAADKTKLDGIAAGAEVNVNADWNATSGDAQILNKPSTFAPSAHSSSHAPSGSDPLAPSDIGAQSLFTSASQVLSADFTLTSGRATKWTLQNYNGTTYNVTLPTTNIQAGDVVVIAAGTLIGPQTIREANVGGGSFVTLATLSEGQSYRFVSNGTESNSWGIDQVYTHTHELTALAATGATNGHVLTANGGGGVSFAALPASGVSSVSSSASDVLGVSGANITGVDANADRIVYWNNTSNKLAYGTPADAGAAAASHTHTSADINSQTASNGHVLTANGSGGASFAALPASGISNVDSTLADVMSVSGSNLVADDGGLVDSSNPALVWDDAAGKAVWANPLRRTAAGAFYVGAAPTTTALGTNAVNIQPSRSSSANVTSGNSSVGIGDNSRSTGNSSISVGIETRATATSSTALGNDILASGIGSIGIGTSSYATSVRGVAIGTGVTADLRSQFVCMPFSSVFWGGQTTNNTATILNLDATATNRFTIAANTALAVDILLVARRSDVADKWLVARRFLGIRRDGSNNTSLIGAVQTLGTDQSAGSPTWSFTLTADDTNEALQLEVTGATSETVQWRATAMYRVV